MQPDPVHLADIVERADMIARSLEGRTEEEFVADDDLHDAVTYRLAIIGEAARNLSEELTAHHSEVPWRRIVAFRNFALHEYPAIDLGRVWTTATDDAPRLRTQVMAILDDDFPLVAAALRDRNA